MNEIDGFELRCNLENIWLRILFEKKSNGLTSLGTSATWLSMITFSVFISLRISSSLKIKIKTDETLARARTPASYPL